VDGLGERMGHRCWSRHCGREIGRLSAADPCVAAARSAAGSAACSARSTLSRAARTCSATEPHRSQIRTLALRRTLSQLTGVLLRAASASGGLRPTAAAAISCVLAHASERSRRAHARRDFRDPRAGQHNPNRVQALLDNREDNQSRSRPSPKHRRPNSWRRRPDHPSAAAAGHSSAVRPGRRVPRPRG
jgi:hypothetical protein